MPVIGLDYDDTFTTDPHAWAEAMHVLRAAGFTIVGTTFRYEEHEPIKNPLYTQVCDAIIYCNRESKAVHAERAGYKVDIWIDDIPQYVMSGVPQIHRY